MKPATPILRNEHYLDVMTGGSASLPSPILREERYLAKLAGMEVSIPIPVTIKEKYYAKICGMDVDVPTYTRNMPRIYAYMAKAAGQTIEDLPTAVTREQRYWYDYVSEPPVTEHEYTGAVPYTFNANGEPLLDWYIKGNTTQSTTPTPDNPIMPEGTEERTGNLFDGNYTIAVMSVSGNTATLNTTSSGRTAIVKCEPNTTYTVKKYSASNRFIIAESDIKPANGTAMSIIQNDSSISEYTFTTSNTTQYVAVFCSTSSEQAEPQLMFNLGATAFPYENYGYKIPISTTGQTTNVYLGEVQTTRKIQKLVLTGEEEIANPSTKVYRFNVTNYLRELTNKPYCTHYVGITPVSSVDGLGDKRVAFLISSSGNNYMYIRDSDYSSIAAFKQFLSDQYANGTPVCVWYILAEPTTGIVNEPLRKIGEYADTLSMEQAGVNIPTNNGSTTIDVETTLKPSEVYIKWKGAAT